jgi:hypothetical protein
MTLHEARMSPHDDTIERLAVLIACGIADHSMVEFSSLLIGEADHDGPGRVLATVDGAEYLITVAPNSEQAATLPVPPSERIAQLRAELDLASEFRIPCTNQTGGYAEVVVERGMGHGCWGVTDGSFTGRQVWVDGAWRYLSDVGKSAGYCHTRDAALTLGHQVAAIEGAAIDARIARLRGEA